MNNFFHVWLITLLSFSVSANAAEPVIVVRQANIQPAVTADPVDPAWVGVPIIALGPVENQTVGSVLPQTGVQLVWLPTALYVRFLCRDDDIYAPLIGRDALLYKADAIEVFIDPVGDGRAVYEFQVSPNGDLFDQLILNTAPIMSWKTDGIFAGSANESWAMLEWNAKNIHQAARSVSLPDGPGWIADIAISTEVLRRTRAPTFGLGSLRAHLVRVDQQLQADGSRLFSSASFAPYPNGNPHRTAVRMGRLELTHEH